ncbi:DNA helicase [Peribacillus frigoritolerans]|nr:DNA helicase [Peribacillus frigoritolerans]
MEKVPVKTIKKIEEDIEKNDLGKARDRLHGLISTYPNELELRRRLGDIYFALKYPSMAGRYWYLEKNKTSEMVKACILFEKSMGNDPLRIARALKFKGDNEILIRLELDQVISPIQNKVKESLLERPDDQLKDNLFSLGCFSIIILTILFALIGVYTLFNWIF